MTASPANATDLADRWRALTPAEQVTATTKLADAWALLQSKRATLDANMTAGTVRRDVVVYVLCEMVQRAMTNPERKSQEQIDDYSYRRDASVADGSIYATDAELALVTPAYTGTTRGSVRLVAYGDL